MNTNEVLAHAGLRAARRGRCTPTTTSTPRSRRTTCSRPRSTSPPCATIVRRPAPRRSTTSRAELRRQASAHVRTVVKAGRTHLMDATPVTLGQEFGGYAAPGRAAAVERLRDALPRVGELPLGGTAVGHRHQRADRLRPRRHRAAWPPTWACRSSEAPRPLRGPGRAGRAGRGQRAAAGRSRSSLIKIANDLRWMGSGPADRAGRDPPPRPAAGLVDHAGQGEPGDPRGRHPGDARR